MSTTTSAKDTLFIVVLWLVVVVSVFGGAYCALDGGTL